MQTKYETNSARIAQLEARIENAELRYAAAQRRLRFQGSLALAATIGAVLVSPANRAAFAQGYSVTLASLNTRMLAVEAKTQFQSTDPVAKSTTFSGCNLTVNNGSTNSFATVTNAAGDGLGNLIVGYNTRRGGYNDRRGGSHNLVLGVFNNYTSNCGIIGGNGNEVAGNCSTIITGFGNQTSADYTLIGTGAGNNASFFVGCVLGGAGNLASANGSIVLGGRGNTASGYQSIVSGGYENLASGECSAVSGGNNNTSSQTGSSLSGGRYNTASGSFSAVSGGIYNLATFDYTSVTGGVANSASGSGAAVSGGFQLIQAATNGWSAGTYHTP